MKNKIEKLIRGLQERNDDQEREWKETGFINDEYGNWCSGRQSLREEIILRLMEIIDENS